MPAATAFAGKIDRRGVDPGLSPRSFTPRIDWPAVPDPEAVDVIATLAHEFRTPIASLRATVEAMVADREILSAEQTTEMLNRLQRGTVWLQGFVENFLSSVSLDAQQLSIRRRPVVLGECLEQVLPMVEPLMARRGQRVEVRGPIDTVVDGDPYRLAQVLLNLLVNASKYSVVEDVVELEVTTDGEAATIRVADHGPGIPECERELVFLRYARGTRAVETSAGLGLGLTIARALVELHGGNIWVESTPGGGASFCLTLPLSSAGSPSIKPFGRNM
jgi:signal transduction histidine kinase